MPDLHLRARRCARRAPCRNSAGDVEKFWIVESKDARIAAPAGTEILVRDFPRGISLSGRGCIEGISLLLFLAGAAFLALAGKRSK